jgi:Mor family transcriptional regulator
MRPAEPNEPQIRVDDLPVLLRDFVHLIGITATMRLVEEYGGTRIYIPKRDITEDHELAHIIGLAHLRTLARVYGGEKHFELPKASHALAAIRRREIIASYGPKSLRQLAREYRLTERRVSQIIAEANAERHAASARQVALF